MPCYGLAKRAIPDTLPGVPAADLSAEAFDLFRQRAAESGRVDAQALYDSNEAFLYSLNLLHQILGPRYPEAIE